MRLKSFVIGKGNMGVKNYIKEEAKGGQFLWAIGAISQTATM